ncbi:uncharacterized protein PG986_015006 [Apiospora aurea]|uniref:Uncharacterized protein n=1 Tax=Apiospora aurea TaxID=335848 RepID=A0ABR1PUX5_9PEZI
MSNTRKNHARDKFTAEMQDEQAKGKEPFDDPEENKNLDGEVFISQAQRRFALQILDDPESYNRSTTHRRFHFLEFFVEEQVQRRASKRKPWAQGLSDSIP